MTETQLEHLTYVGEQLDRKLGGWWPAGSAPRRRAVVFGMVCDSSSELLVLHAVRIQGMTDKDRIALRFALNPDTVEELLLDDEASG